MTATLPSPLTRVDDHPGRSMDIELYIKRDDLLHPLVSGNKWRKLEPVIQAVQRREYHGILTYGGAFSNHLHAVAAAGKAYGFPTAGIVRGQAADLQNATLAQAQASGMQLFAVQKRDYQRGINSSIIRDIITQYPDYYHLPEGGFTALAVNSCQRIAVEIRDQLYPDVRRPLIVCVPAGTGCTAAGVVAGLDKEDAAWIFPAVNYGVDEATIHRYLPAFSTARFQFISDYTFGGFAVYKPALWQFVRNFQVQTGMLLDPIYTSKMLFGIFDLLAKGAFSPGSTVVAVHTGGLQGWAGFQARFGSLNTEFFKLSTEKS